MQRKAALFLTIAFALTFPACAGKEAADKVDETSAAEPASEVAAVLGEESISMDEVDAAVAGELRKLRQQEYELRRRAVEQIVAEKLLEKEASARGLTMEELFQEEVDAKVADPSDDEIKQFYDANKARYAQIRDKSLEEASPLVRQALRQQKLVERQREYIEALRANRTLRVLLDPPRSEVEVPEGEPSRGPAEAPVTIVEFADFQCGYCRRVYPSLENILTEYGDKVRFVYRDFALSFHPRAEPAAVAARCAGEQDKYWEYYDGLMTKPTEFSDDDLKTRAADLGLDAEKFGECYGSDRHIEAVRAGLEDGQSLGVTGTPTFFINGRMLVGAVSEAEIREVIDDELQRATGS